MDDPRWQFLGDQSGKEQSKDPLEGLFGGRSQLDAVEILVREALQNSLDAGGGAPGPVRVCFRIRTVAGADKARFLRALGFDGLRRHVEASRSVLEGLASSYVDPREVENADALTLLYIEDYQTCGLVGREFKRRRTDPEDYKQDCFLGLCRAVGRNDKGSTAGAGGTYGFGKGVYWAASSMGTALFHSVLREPWTPGEADLLQEETVETVRARLFGVARLVSHQVDDQDLLPEGHLTAGQLDPKQALARPEGTAARL